MLPRKLRNLFPHLGKRSSRGGQHDSFECGWTTIEKKEWIWNAFSFRWNHSHHTDTPASPSTSQEVPVTHNTNISIFTAQFPTSCQSTCTNGWQCHRKTRYSRCEDSSAAMKIRGFGDNETAESALIAICSERKFCRTCCLTKDSENGRDEHNRFRKLDMSPTYGPNFANKTFGEKKKSICLVTLFSV